MIKIHAKQKIGIEIDRFTRSIEHTISGDRFNTDVVALTEADFNRFNQKQWLFDWYVEYKGKNKGTFKLIVAENPLAIHGLISLFS